MANKPNVATLSLDSNRKSYCIKFRHPRRFTADNKPGLAVRRGLGTEIEAEARHYADQLNQILADESLWAPAAKEVAAKRFHPKVVEAFYTGLGATFTNPAQDRDREMPLPGRDDGYRRVLLLGTFGAGKTTLVRQILGTNPETERFPATSANRTTTAKLEVILDDGPYRAVATFLQRDEVRQYVEECVVEAALAYLGDRRTDEVARRLLEHRDQRFRLSHILGTLPTKTSKFVKAFEGTDSATEKVTLKDAANSASENEPDPLTDADREKMREALRGYIGRIQSMTDGWCERAATLQTESDGDEAKQRYEEQLPEEADFDSLIDDICEEIGHRFTDLAGGRLEYGKDKWPTLWSFSTDDRGEFMRTIGRLTGNHERHFGRLLTPLVEGIRVAGPFRPLWRDTESPPRLVIIDGEGLGHKIEAIANVPTSVSRLFGDVDVILLVDTARQPMQAAPSVAVKTIVAAGYESKLMICFTHLDLVEGDNLPDDSAKMNHVLYALTNLLDKVGQDIGPDAEQALERGLVDRVFFASHLNRMTFPPEAVLTHNHLNNLIDAVEATAEPDRTDLKLFYEDHKLPLGVRTALKSYHQTWQAALGLQTRPDIPKQHWARVKALTRHIGLLGKDEYVDLKPTADLISRLLMQISRYLDRPHHTDPDDADEEVRLAAISRVKNQVHSGLLELVHNALIKQQSLDWQAAYNLSGPGSSLKRAQAIRAIFETAAPMPDNPNGPNSIDLLQEIKKLVEGAIKEVGGRSVQVPVATTRINQMA